jgi:hypothetical protein
MWGVVMEAPGQWFGFKPGEVYINTPKIGYLVIFMGFFGLVVYNFSIVFMC